MELTNRNYSDIYLGDIENRIGIRGASAIHHHNSQYPEASIMGSLRIPPIIVAGDTCPNFGRGTCRALRRMSGHSLAILMTTYAHLARYAPYAHYVHYIPGTQDESAHLMDDILTQIPIILSNLRKMLQKPVSAKRDSTRNRECSHTDYYSYWFYLSDLNQTLEFCKHLINGSDRCPGLD